MNDDDHRPEHQQRPFTVPFSAMASEADMTTARRLLAVHRPRTVARQVCTGCGKAWPCLDMLYAWAMINEKPGPTDPDVTDGH